MVDYICQYRILSRLPPLHVPIESQVKAAGCLSMPAKLVSAFTEGIVIKRPVEWFPLRHLLGIISQSSQSIQAKDQRRGECLQEGFVLSPQLFFVPLKPALDIPDDLRGRSAFGANGT